jgi:hypothetical protein
MALSPSLRIIGDTRAHDVAVVDGSGNHLTGFDPTRPATATITSVAASTTSVSLLAANASRRRVVITNDGNATLYIAFAATASTTAFTYVVAKGQVFDGPLNDYTGDISGIWSSVSGNARITEISS